MGTFIVVAVIVVICAYAVYSCVHKLRCGGGCCGEHEPPEKKVRVEDRDRSHYPYSAVLSIDGMTCGNCARRVENALNRMDGTWAQVDLGTKQAVVHLKGRPDEAVLRQTVREAGYTVCAIRRQDV